LRDSDVVGVIVVGTGTQTSFLHSYPDGQLLYKTQEVGDKGVVGGVVVDFVGVGTILQYLPLIQVYGGRYYFP